MKTHSHASKAEAGQRQPVFWARSFSLALFGAVVLSFCLCLGAVASMCGSGFIIRSDGYILTNYHVIKNGTKFTVTVPGHPSVPARLITSDQDKDLAILQISLRNITALPITSSEKVQVLDTITVLGYPLPTELGTALSAFDGKVNAIREGHDGGTPLFQIDANVNPGNSGGPLLNDRGEVVGIIVAKINSFQYAKENGTIPERINFAIPINEAQELVRKVIPNLTLSDRQQVLTEQQVFASAKNSTVLIVSEQDDTSPKTYAENQDNGALERFIAEFVRAGESESNSDQSEFYASPCDYYQNGQCTRESIARELQDYNLKWPSRQYRLLDAPVVNVANQGGPYNVGFKVDFVLHNRKGTVSGTCSFRVELVRREKSFLITSIREKFSTGGSPMSEGGTQVGRLQE